MAIKTFGDQTTADIYHSLNTKAARRIPADVWGPARRQLALLNASASTLEMSKNPGMRFKPLKWDRPGFNSIRATLIYRIIFRFVNGDAYDVTIENDHGKHTS